MMASADNSFGYEMEIIVPADSPIKSRRFKGQKIAFTDATSNSGFKAPSAILKADFKLESQARLRAGVLRQARQLDPRRGQQGLRGGGDRQFGDEPDDRPQGVRQDEVRSIYKSQTFPTTGYGHAYNLDPKLVEKIKEAFFTFPWEGSALEAEFKKEDKFIPIAYKEDWAVMRKIDEATGVKYTCK